MSTNIFTIKHSNTRVWGIWSSISYRVESQPWQNFKLLSHITAVPPCEFCSALFKCHIILEENYCRNEQCYYGDMGHMSINWTQTTDLEEDGIWNPLITICTMAKWPAQENLSVYQQNHEPAGSRVLWDPLGSTVFTSSETPRTYLLMSQCDRFLSFLSKWEKLGRLYCTLLITVNINKWTLLLKI